MQPDGKILIGGYFTSLGGLPPAYLGRLNPDGSADITFTPRANGQIFALAGCPDGTTLVSGGFESLGGPKSVFWLGRLNPSGTSDNGFGPQIDDLLSLYLPAALLAVQQDGKILARSAWGNLRGYGERFGRLNSDGTLDSEFIPGIDGLVSSLMVQADGKIIVSGEFTRPRANIARLNTDGTLDTFFSSVAVGGTLALQANGSILVGRQRLNTDGNLDPWFNPRATVRAIQADGRILAFDNESLVRLNNSEPAMQSLSLYGKTITWLRGGSSPGVWRTTFEASADDGSWIYLGAGQLTPGGWQLANSSVAKGATIRARGYLAGGGKDEGIVESQLRLFPQIITTDGVFGIRSNRFGFNVTGLPNEVIVLESSTNLLQWFSLQTNTLGSGPIYFSDTDWGQRPQRFYRTRLL